MNSASRKFLKIPIRLMALFALLMCFSSLAPVVYASSSPNYVLCSSTTAKVVGSTSTSNSAYYLEAELYANFDSHEPTYYCGTMFAFAYVTQQPYAVGGTLHATIYYNGTSNTGTSSVGAAGEGGGEGTAGSATVGTTCAAASASFYPSTGGSLITPDTGTICE